MKDDPTMNKACWLIYDKDGIRVRVCEDGDIIMTIDNPEVNWRTVGVVYKLAQAMALRQLKSRGRRGGEEGLGQGG